MSPGSGGKKEGRKEDRLKMTGNQSNPSLNNKEMLQADMK